MTQRPTPMIFSAWNVKAHLWTSQAITAHATSAMQSIIKQPQGLRCSGITITARNLSMKTDLSSEVLAVAAWNVKALMDVASDYCPHSF